MIDLKAAYECDDLHKFMQMVFPEEWLPVAARIIESGAYFGETTKFAPRWSPIPFTKRIGRTPEETYLKSIIYRVHDCLHQLWGLPVPRDFTSDTERAYFKRMWMCAEVAVLTITEFFYCQWLYDTQPHCRDFLEHRNTLRFKRTTGLRFKSMQQTAARLDELIHKQTMPWWVAGNEYGLIFCKDYVPMLEQDRTNIDHNWALLQAMPNQRELLSCLPNQRYSSHLDGLELTLAMIADFEHIIAFTDDAVDWQLAEFNASRRMFVTLPDSWNEPK
jgi:hypothetical protein